MQNSDTYEQKARAYLTKSYYEQNPSDDCFVPHLEDWLRVLYLPDVELAEGYWNLMLDGGLRHNKMGEYPHIVMMFDLTTGQPATPEDYQAFNTIVGI